MATDACGHTVPASTDHPSRADLLNLSLSIGDAIPVANATARATLITTLAGLGITASTASPIRVWRADAAVGAQEEITTDGTTWMEWRGGPWTAYTPAFTNFALGNGTLSAYYTVVGKTVTVRVSITLGSTTSVISNVYIGLPVTPGAGYPTWSLIGSVGLIDISGGAFRVAGGFTSGSTARITCADGTQLGTTSPWTWTTGDIISALFVYESA